MNKGTSEGTREEIKFVKELNKNKSSVYWEIMNLSFKKENVFAVHVITKKDGKINGEKVLPKADIFLAYSEEKILAPYLEKKGFYLNEEDFKALNLTSINYTGISVKRPDSKKYQILKMSPSTFKTIFGNYELGAGASIYCEKSSELSKNDSVLLGWNTNWEKFNHFFRLKARPMTTEEFGKIKEDANREIHKRIHEDKFISDFVFRGAGNFDEPFTATWFYERGILKQAEEIPFVVTTGSGRSHGDFTIVIKPK